MDEGESAAPQGPYLYSSRAYVGDRVVNRNFQDNLNPAPARGLTTRVPSGMPRSGTTSSGSSTPGSWSDAGDAHLPPQYTRLETSANIRFVPTAGGAGFSYPFSDDNPRYTSPGTLSYPFGLTTNPFWFRAQDVIMEPGTLQWDARLLVAYADDRVPLWIDFAPPPGITDTNALNAEVASQRLRWRDPAPGEAARRYRVSYTPRTNDHFDIHIDVTEEDGRVLPRRTIPNAGRSGLLVPALVISIGTRSSFDQRNVEVRASQRVPFSGRRRAYRSRRATRANRHARAAIEILVIAVDEHALQPGNVVPVQQQCLQGSQTCPVDGFVASHLWRRCRPHRGYRPRRSRGARSRCHRSGRRHPPRRRCCSDPSPRARHRQGRLGS